MRLRQRLLQIGAYVKADRPGSLHLSTGEVQGAERWPKAGGLPTRSPPFLVVLASTELSDELPHVERF